MKPFLLCAIVLTAVLLPVQAQQTPTVTEIKPRQNAAPPGPKPSQSKSQAPNADPKTPPLLWKTFLKRLDNAPAIDSNASPDKTTLYLGANGSLMCLDSGGRTQWATALGATQARPAFDDVRVYMGTDRGAFYAVNRDTGRVIWKYLAPSTILTAPVIAEHLVRMECSDGSVTALQAATGTLVWSFKRPDGSLGYSSPLLSGGAIFVCGENTVYKLNSSDGKEIWRIPIGGKSLATPAADATRVFVGSDGVGITALGTKTGTGLWLFDGADAKATKPTGDWFGAPLAVGETVYVSTYNRWIYALDAQTGSVKWSYRLLGNALNQPALDAKNNVLYVTSVTFRDNPTVTALDARTGKKIWDYKAGYVAAPPVLAEGRLYVASTNGYLYAFGVR